MIDLFLYVAGWLLPLAHAAEAVFNPSLPGNIASGNDPAGTIVNLYQFAMLVAGILAFGIIVYAGILYSLSAGNPGGQADARDRILQAFLGLLLLVGAYVILYTLNPGLTQLQLPKLVPIEAARTEENQYEIVDGINITLEESASTAPGTLQTTGGCVTNESQCVRLNSLGLQCNPAHCKADQRLAGMIRQALQDTGVDPNTVRVGDAYPPGGDHENPRHKNGCAVDLVLTAAKSCADVKRFFNAALANGATGMNEYVQQFPGCGRKSRKWTGDHIHLNGCN